MDKTYFNRLEGGSGSIVFFKVLKMWRGSLYKLVMVDLIVYMILYYIINFIYRFLLNEERRAYFVRIVQFSEEVKGQIPFFFLLGFFVTGVIGRWYQMYLNIPWLNRPAFTFEGYINGRSPKESLRVRQTVLRYINLSWILLMRKISDQIGDRFRKRSVDDGASSAGSEETNVRDIFINFNRDRKIQQTYGKIITDDEIRAFETIAVQSYKTTKKTYEPEYWIPMMWASRVLQKAFLHNYVNDPRTTNKMIEELDDIRKKMQNLDIYCGIMIPLVYTQVVIIAVYSYFLCELLAGQAISGNSHQANHGLVGPWNTTNTTSHHQEFDSYFPIFTIFNFLFMMGWLKVAMCVMNPFGDDDEDFPTSEILDYNLDVTQRSISGEIDMFPEKLDPAPMVYNCRFEINPPDNLEHFLEHIGYDIEEINRDLGHTEVKALEMKRGMMQRFRDKCCCNPSVDTPKERIPLKASNHIIQATSGESIDQIISASHHSIISGTEEMKHLA